MHGILMYNIHLYALNYLDTCILDLPVNIYVYGYDYICLQITYIKCIHTSVAPGIQEMIAKYRATGMQ